MKNIVIEQPCRGYRQSNYAPVLQASLGPVFVRQGYSLRPCTGFAHTPDGAHQDNCSVCLGAVWGWMAVKKEA